MVECDNCYHLFIGHSSGYILKSENLNGVNSENLLTDMFSMKLLANEVL